MTREEKKKRKQYRKFNKKYKKELIEIVKKHYGPYDNFLGDFFDVIVQHWKDYYKLGYNVWGVEIKDTPEFNDPTHPTRYEIACELERRYNEWVNFNVFNEHRPTVKEEFLLPDGKINHELVNQRWNELKKSFFDYYMQYSADMWDQF